MSDSFTKTKLQMIWMQHGKFWMAEDLPYLFHCKLCFNYKLFYKLIYFIVKPESDKKTFFHFHLFINLSEIFSSLFNFKI